MKTDADWKPIDTAPRETDGLIGYDPNEGIEIIYWSDKAYRPGGLPWEPGWECPLLTIEAHRSIRLTGCHFLIRRS